MNIAKTILLAGLLTLGMACGYSSHATTPPAAGTAPAITLLNPDNADAGASFELVVTGTSFNNSAVVNFNGAQTPSAVTSTQITVTIPAGAVMTAGSVNVTVTNPGTPGGQYGGGTLPETSAAMAFTVN